MLLVNVLLPTQISFTFWLQLISPFCWLQITMVQTWIQAIALLMDSLLAPHYLGLGVWKGFYSRFRL
jgi:hypothetical protein